MQQKRAGIILGALRFLGVLSNVEKRHELLAQ